MKKVDRACHSCKYGEVEVYIKHANPDLAHLHADHTELTVTDDPCDICGATPSFRKQ